MLEFTVIGNLGSDARVVNQDGRQFVAFNVAHTDKWTDQAGTSHETTEWVSCTLNGDGGNILPYLKQGVKVYVCGRGSTRVYSSPKERQMKAGANISVTRIELVGGSSDEVPRELIDPATGSIKRVFKAFYVDQSELQNVAFDDDVALLQDRKGNQFSLQKAGWVIPIKPQETTATEGEEQR